MDDAELVQQVLQGNRGAYSHLIDRYTAQIRALCRAHVWRQDAIDDLVQETFCRGLQHLRSLERLERFGAWLYGLARNLCRDWHKDPHHRQASLEALPDWTQAAFKVDGPASAGDNLTERVSELMEAVRRLPLELREPLVLYYASAVTYAQLAEKLDISVPLVNKRLTQARKQLRDGLGGKFQSLPAGMNCLRRVSGGRPGQRLMNHHSFREEAHMIDCNRALELISARIDQEITFDDEALNNHLETCAACRKELEEVRRLDEFLVHAFAPERDEAEVLVDQVKAVLQKRGQNARRCTVLIVDDEPDVMMSLRIGLAEEFDVLTAANAQAAQQCFPGRDIDIILTDQGMEGMKGVALLEWVLEKYPRTQRLLMTGYGEFQEAVEAINRGHVFRYLLKPFHLEALLNDLRGAVRVLQLERENERVLRELSELNVRLEERVKQRTRELEEANRELELQTRTLERFALTDALTQLPNPRSVEYLLKLQLRWRERDSLPLTVAIIDVDFFREINRKHLHPGGDQVLRELAKCMTAALRKIDVLGRMGGEEFLLIAPQTDRAGALVLCERLRAQVEAHVFTFKGQTIPVTVSVGLAVVGSGRATNYEQIKLAADAALMRAKANGRNRVEIEAVVPTTAAEEPPGPQGIVSA